MSYRTDTIRTTPYGVGQWVDAETALLSRGRWNGACLEWTGTTTKPKQGYGVLGFQGKRWLSHRLAWTVAYGPIPPGVKVLHRCDNSLCFLAEHLFLGTQQDNIDDMRRKGRGRSVSGENHYRSRLTKVQVTEIRALKREGRTNKEVAQLFGVCESTVSHICTGKTWKS